MKVTVLCTRMCIVLRSLCFDTTCQTWYVSLIPSSACIPVYELSCCTCVACLLWVRVAICVTTRVLDVWTLVMFFPTVMYIMIWNKIVWCINYNGSTYLERARACSFKWCMNWTTNVSLTPFSTGSSLIYLVSLPFCSNRRGCYLESPVPDPRSRLQTPCVDSFQAICHSVYDHGQPL